MKIMASDKVMFQEWMKYKEEYKFLRKVLKARKEHLKSKISIYLYEIQISILILWILFLFICLVFVFNFYSLDKLQYVLSEKSLMIKWGFLRKEIPFETIKKIMITPTRYFQGIQLGGFRSPGYHIGLFEILIEGKPIKITLYTTNLKSLITIVVKKGEKTKYYGLTPKNPNKFIEELNIRRRLYQFNIEKSIRSRSN